MRDRDRIRQSVLEGLGWKIYRIWSTDWFADPARELTRLLGFLDQHRAAHAALFAQRPKPTQGVDPDPDLEPAGSPPAPEAAPATVTPLIVTLATLRAECPGWDYQTLHADFRTWIEGDPARTPVSYQNAFIGFVRRFDAKNRHTLR